MIEPGYEAYGPRAISFLGLRDAEGYRIKLYSIVYGDRPFETIRFEDGLETATSALPQPARAVGRPGLAVAIAHQGRGCDYLVMSWWGRENELPTKVFVRDSEGWRSARDDESFCVWDMQVLWFEREAYVATLLAGGRGAASEAYLGRHLNVTS